MWILTLYGCNTGKYLSFDGLKKSTATGRYIRYLVGKTELVDTSYRVTTAYK